MNFINMWCGLGLPAGGKGAVQAIFCAVYTLGVFLAFIGLEVNLGV